MRRSDLHASPSLAPDVLSSVSVAHLVVDGPHIRPIHPVWEGGTICWHGAPKGERASWEGRPAVLSAHQIVAEIPSYFRHPERACPATTYYRSVQVRGTIRSIAPPGRRLAVLEALMQRYQPEGGYRALDPDDPMYAASIRGLGIYALDGEIAVRVKVGQQLKDAERHAVLEGLWRRGDFGDDRAIETVVAAAPEHATLPPFLSGPAGARLITRVPDDRAHEALALVRDAYWNAPWDDATVLGAMRGSEVFVGAELEGRIVGTARAMTDGSKLAYVGDVAVHPDLRGRGIGQAVMTLLLDHPRVRSARVTALKTRDAMAFYAPLGFGEPDRRPGIVDLTRINPLRDLDPLHPQQGEQQR